MPAHHNIAASFALANPSFAAVLTKRIPANRPIARAISARIMATKRRLKAGGLLRQVEWGKRGPQIRGNVRGRRTFTYTPLDVFIVRETGLNRGSGFTTERADDIKLIVLDPVAITDSDSFRWGDNTYSVSKIDGVIKNESTGVRFYSEVIVIR